MSGPGINALYANACRWRGSLDLFVDPGERFGACAAYEASRRVASALISRGLAPGERVAFLCKPSARHAIAWFGVLAAGGVAASLHIRESTSRLGETLEWLDARFVIHDEDLAALADDAIAPAERAVEPISLGDEGADRIAWPALAGAPIVALPDARPDDLAAIVLSSGSTGRPKGVMHTQRTLAENARAGPALYGTIDLDDATLVMMQPSFAAWMIVVLPFVIGRAKVVFGPVFTPRIYLETLARERITNAPAVPTMWRMILAEDTTAYDLGALRSVSISGEPPSRNDLVGIDERICRRILSFYTSSELAAAGGILATERVTLGAGAVGAAGKPESSGRPVPGADLRIIDPDGGFDAELPAGEIGEMLIASPSLAVGYWKDPALTEARFRDGWWRSGDIARVDDDGDVFVLGRTDNVINSGGIKMHGEEIERVLLRHPALAQAAVVGVADAQWGQRVEAHVVLRPDARPRLAADRAGDALAAELAAFCRTSDLAGFKIPRRFHFVEQLPSGPTGKLYRRALRGE